MSKPPPNSHADHPGFDADLAISLTGTGPGDDVVDIGCGPGVAVRRAAARGGASVTGVDPRP
ncbi:MAG TPA: hypothetical protein VFZ77_01485 [Acidimicrobiales bacterium]